MNKQLVLVEFCNCRPFIYEVVSDKPITITNVVKYFIDTEDFNDERDNLTFVDDVTQIKL